MSLFDNLMSGLKGPVGNNRKNNEEDVAAVRRHLGTLNYRTDEDKAEGILTRPLDKAIKDFQKDEGLVADGWLGPNGPTEKALGVRLAQNISAKDGDIPRITVRPMPKQSSSKTIDATMDDDQIIDFVKGEEEFIPWPYVDSTQNVTIGIGTMLPNVQNARKLPLYYERNGQRREATQADIDEGFEALAKMGNHGNFSADHYEDKTNLRMTETPARELSRRHLAGNASHLKQQFPGFVSFPEDARLGLIGMDYNVGLNRAEWPKLFEAIDRKDWDAVAAESHISNIGDKRNKRTGDLFRGAGKAN